MNLGYILSGAAPVKKRYKVGVTMTTAAGGFPVMVATTADAGVIFLPATAITAVTDCVGVTLDTAVYSTTQSSTVEGLITVIINPDAVWRLHAIGSAAAGVQLDLTTNTTASTGGTVITKTGASGAGDPDLNSPTKLEGTAFCTSGGNKGQSRKITTVGATSATVTVPFTNTIAVGDEFIVLPWEIAGANSNLVWLSTNLDEARANVAANSVGMTCGVVDIEVDFADTASARNRTFVHALISDQILKDLTT